MTQSNEQTDLEKAIDTESVELAFHNNGCKCSRCMSLSAAKRTSELEATLNDKQREFADAIKRLRELEQKLKEVEKERDELRMDKKQLIEIEVKQRDELKIERDQLHSLAKQLAEALQCADNGFFGSPEGQQQIDKALSLAKEQGLIE